MHHYKGDASQILEKWRAEIIQILAHAEAYIDFEEHEVSKCFISFILRKMCNQMYSIKLLGK
jgi:tRNA U34 5-carboxymethylaminomethyl modifying GTPase MnmE/TrmE